MSVGGRSGERRVAAGAPREVVELRGEVVDLRAPLLLALLLAFAHLGGGETGRQERCVGAGAIWVRRWSQGHHLRPVFALRRLLRLGKQRYHLPLYECELLAVRTLAARLRRRNLV